MSPYQKTITLVKVGVPRASGDEPQIGGAIRDIGKCSPRERG